MTMSCGIGQCILVKTHGIIQQNEWPPQIGMCFHKGLPDQVKQLLHATQMDMLAIDQLLAWVWAIMKDEVVEECLAVAAVCTIQDGMKKLPTGSPHDTITCHHCNSLNHFAKDCVGLHTKRQKPQICCYRCNEIGHISQNCPQNNPGEETSAPVCSPNSIWMRHYLQLLYASVRTRVQPWWTWVVNGHLVAEHFVTPGRRSGNTHCWWWEH